MEQFLKTKDDVLREFEVTLQSGLSDSQVEKSREKHGENKFTEVKRVSLFEKVIEALKEPMTLILVFAGFIALGVNVIASMRGGHADFIEVVGIFFAIALSVVITIAMEGRSEKAFEELNKIKDDMQVKVVRNGEVKLIPQNELVVGDVYLIETGDKIAADGRLIASSSLRVNESALTGESESVKKNEDCDINDIKTPVAERYNMVYSGCFVESGSGSIVVSDVGDATEFGNIAKELSSADKGSTPIQEKLGKLGQTIAVLGGIVSLAVFLIQLFNLVNGGIATFENVSEAFINSIVLIVAAVPEGLPTIVAISLSLNVVKLAKQNALVKKLVASETVGSINIICSDKTGTLTENKMTLAGVYEFDKLISPKEIENQYLINNFAVNSTADIKLDDEANGFIGNPTECAILLGYEKSGKKSYKKIRDEAQILHVYPFSSETKNMTTITKNNEKKIVYTKGSPGKIMGLCDRIMIDGKEEELTSDIKANIENKIISYQKKANRVLAFAHKVTNEAYDFDKDRKKIEAYMVYDGFITITDPLREDVYGAVSKCHDAGMEVKMLTGDNIVTATVIAQELGIIENGKKIVQARDIEDLTDEEFNKILPEVSVIARSTPVVKMRVVKTLKNQGNVVAVTGDGINDAPAIKNADVGIAMGISGTEVSKEASDIVLIDDSFTTIVKAVKWGRGVYDNFKRFIQFQLSVNLSSVVVVLCSIIAGFASPFSALELLWINLIMDGPPALTLGLEPVRDDILDRKPTKRDENIISSDMMRTIVFNGLFITALFMIQLFNNPLGATPEEASTVLFTMFVVCNLFNAFNAREIGNGSILKNITNNKTMLLVFGITFLLQVVITQFAGTIFKTVPLTLDMWGKIMLAGLSVIAASEIFRFFSRLISKEE